MRFLNFYESNDNTRTLPYKIEKKDTKTIPLYFDCIEINEETKTLEMSIPRKMFPYLVEQGIIILKKGNEIFKNLEEAIKYHKNFLKENNKMQEDDKEDKLNIVKSGIKWVDDEGNEFDFEYSIGNVKVGSDTIIINMSTATDCMSLKLGFCPMGSKGICYAMNPERRYDLVRQYRQRQAKQWECMTPTALGEALIAISNHDKSIKFVRVNEAGEFRGPDDMEKLKKVAEYTKSKNSPLIFYTYTHRIDLFKDGEDSNMGDNVIVNGSDFMIDNAFMPLEYQEYSEIIKKLKNERTKAYRGEVPISKNKITECLGSCAICDKCKVKRKQYIYLAIHGIGSKYESAKKKLKNSFIKNPKITEIIKSNKDKEQKMKEIVSIISPEQNLDLSILLKIVSNKKEFWDSLISDEEMKIDLLNSIYNYVELINPIINVGEINEKPSHTDQMLADKASMDAFFGKLKSELERAKKEGIAATEDLYRKAIKSVEKAIKNIEYNMSNPKKIKKVSVGKFPATKFKQWNK